MLLLLGSSCKRAELELTDSNNLVLPASGTIASARSIEDERSANLKRQIELDQTISMLKNALANSKNLSAGQREELHQKIAAAEQEKANLNHRDKELADTLAATQKALDEARTRNEELNKELQKAKAAQANKEAPTGATESPSKAAPLGPFTLFKGDQCLEVQNKSPSDSALLGMGSCTSEAQQSFLFEQMDASGSYRILAQSSQKCLAVEKGSSDLGAKLLQTSCVESDISQQFYILGLNDSDFLLQNVKSQYCFSLQPDKSLIQAVCDPKLETTFRINNSTR